MIVCLCFFWLFHCKYSLEEPIPDYRFNDMYVQMQVVNDVCVVEEYSLLGCM